MNEPKQVIGIKETSRDCWRLSFDGCVLGDSRGYRKDRAETEARAWIARHPDAYTLDASIPR